MTCIRTLQTRQRHKSPTGFPKNVSWDLQSLDWFKGKSTGNHGFYHKKRGVPVNFPVNQSNDTNAQMLQGDKTLCLRSFS